MKEQQGELITTRPGARLRHAREARGLSVEQLASSTRIRERIILAIERDDTDWIAPVYLRGYIRSYARGLGLDAEEFEADTRATSGSDPELRSVFNIGRKRGFAERWLKAGSYVVASMLIAALVWQVTQQAVQFSQGRGANLAAAPSRQVSVAEEKPAEAPAASQNTHLAASIASLEKFNSRSANSAAAGDQAWSAIKAKPQSEGDIVIRVSADSWVEIIDASGTQLEMDLLCGGSHRAYNGVAPFQLMLGRANAIELEYQGAAVDLVPYIHGDVARLTLGEPDQQTP